MNTMEQCIPKARLPNRRNLRWLNKKIIQLIRRRNALFKRAKSQNDLLELPRYKRLRDTAVRAIRSAKKKFFDEIDPSNTKQFWKTVRSLNRAAPSIPNFIDSTVATTNTEKANMLNSFFQSCFNTAPPPLDDNSRVSTLLHSDIPEDLLCTEYDVVDMILKLNTAKTSGPDGISTRMLKSTALTIAYPMSKFLTHLNIRQNSKYSEAKLCCSNTRKRRYIKPSKLYRPISLLSVISKMLERLAHSYIYRHCSTNNLIPDNQWGFLPGRSTTTARISNVHDWSCHLDQHKSVSCIFFDLRKAFDSMPHITLLRKLGLLNLDSHVMTWLADYLTCRRQRVVIKGEFSSTVDVTSGVPQGSVLGPLIFLIFMNDLNNQPLDNGCFLSLYADDMLLYKVLNQTQSWNRAISKSRKVSIHCMCNWVYPLTI